MNPSTQSPSPIDQHVAILDAMPIPVCLFDPNGKLVSSNHLGERLAQHMSKEFFQIHS